MDITTKKHLVRSNIAILVIPILEAAVLANKQRRMQQTGMRLHGGLFLRAAADTQMLSEASTEAMQNGAKPAPFCFCLLPSSISKYSTSNDISLTESSRYIRKIKWLL